ncbi:MAG: HyaD/HybD family hydrogenase maturation endopeptidase [Burkholderiaceae bacterium]
MAQQRAVLVLGIGNILWADEGFGVRAIEALNQAYEFSPDVELADGGTLGMYLLDMVCTSPAILIFDCADLQSPPGTMKVLRDTEIQAWSATKISPHQTGFNDVLAAAALKGFYPERLTVIGVQPELLDDLGGSLTPTIRARIPGAIELAVAELAAWGWPATPRCADNPAPSLNTGALDIEVYEAQRPAAEAACRIGDERFLAQRAAREA